MRSPIAPLLALGSFFALLAAPSVARADMSGWLFVGAGPMNWRHGDDPYSFSGALSFDVGLGTTPDAPFIFGGLFRMTPILGAGTDLALLLRGATRGFQAGDFGLALDAGGYERFWSIRSQGFTGALTLGAPLGFTLSLQANVGTNEAIGFGAIAGVDILRLTVYRQVLLDWWPNPSPAQEVGQTARRP